MSIQGIKDKLVENGVTPENAAKGFAVFLGISYVWVGILWGFCYTFSPSKNILTRIPIKYVQDSLKKQKSIDSYPFFNKLPFGLGPKAGISFCEMILIKGLVAPVSLPLKIWLTIKFLS